ncbi:pentapeptide repeat-containing protein [Saccharothrix algeriensis]|uniref:Pentapeptide repeat-containing protein n=1 Tax=Saccharothrix algeriensis TaxID=173560 RepID=A0ABS2S850_9PSEU|nr:pentapeptide repeat-containing protein [Saccharothrix algeriensis]MBM7812418.1 hypothetical protein [Saccharothrix algeriensis]
MEHLWIAGAVALVVAAVLLPVRRRRAGAGGEPNFLAPALVASIGAFLLVAGWLMAAEPTAPRNEAVKTGGLAGGAVVALYALWLNDRRRRTDEDRQRIEAQRHELENARAEHDRARVADERFARSVELLGHDTEQVRVGAMHALAGLARSRPEYTQTVLDVLCAYLRRPFEPVLADADGTAGGFAEPTTDSEREQEVRFTAQRLIADLLPPVSEAGAAHYDLDLTRAHLQYFDISHRQVGVLMVRAARLHRSNSFHHAVVHRGAWFTDSESFGRLHLHHVVFHGKGWFSRFRAHDSVDAAHTRFLGPNKLAGVVCTGPVTFEGCEFAEPIDFTGAEFRAGVDLRLARGAVARTHGMKVSLEHENLLPAGWVVDRRDGTTGLVRS